MTKKKIQRCSDFCGHNFGRKRLRSKPLVPFRIRVASMVLLFLVSGSDCFSQTGPSKKRKMGGYKGAEYSDTAAFQRRSKENIDIDSIVTDMGLRPAKRKVANGGTEPLASTFLFDPSEVPPIETQLDYARNGHAVLRNLLEPSSLQSVKSKLTSHASRQTLLAWQQKVEVASNSPVLAETCRTVQQCQDELERLGLGSMELPFLQYFNTWRHIADIKKLAFELGHTASVLMNVNIVRLYQDALFWKRAGYGPTPWHTDARMAPFDTSNMITFWIPLQSIPKRGGTALIFVPKSHCDFALPFWNDFETSQEFSRLEERYDDRTVDYMPLSLGDVTVHSGWTLHCADGNASETDRLALAITYVDARAEIREDCLELQQSTKGGGYGDNEDQWSYREWVQQVPSRKQFRHELVPIVWPQEARD